MGDAHTWLACPRLGEDHVCGQGGSTKSSGDQILVGWHRSMDTPLCHTVHLVGCDNAAAAADHTDGADGADEDGGGRTDDDHHHDADDGDDDDDVQAC